MSDKKIEEIQAEIERLEAEKERRVKLLADPKRREVRSLWDQLKSTVDQLDALGENIQDDDGYAPVLVGKTFSMNSSGEIVET